MALCPLAAHHLHQKTALLPGVGPFCLQKASTPPEAVGLCYFTWGLESVCLCLCFCFVFCGDGGHTQTLTHTKCTLYPSAMPHSLSFSLSSFIPPACLPIFLCPFPQYRLLSVALVSPQQSRMLQLPLRQASKFLPARLLAAGTRAERQLLLGGDSVLRDSCLRTLPQVGPV